MKKIRFDEGLTYGVRTTPSEMQRLEVEAGDPDHPGALKDATRLPLSRVPLRDPLTLKPMP